MIGQHFVAPEMKTIKVEFFFFVFQTRKCIILLKEPEKKLQECFEAWRRETDTQKRKDLIVNLLTDRMTLTQTETSVIVTAMVVPPAAMIIKRAGENVPQIKRFRLNLVPDYLFVPVVTFAALFGAKALKQTSLT